MRTMLAIVAAAALALTGCNGNGDTGAEGDLGATTPAPADTTPAADGGQETATVDLAELNDSGISGTATLTSDGDSTTVSVTLDGAGAGPQPIHIHPGTCDDLEPAPQYPLNNVENGTSETTVDASLQELRDGTFAINVHKSPDEAQIYVACGDID